MEDKQQQTKVMLYIIGIVLTGIVLGSWYGTQQVGADCHYAEYLGGLHIGSFAIYQPFGMVVWRKSAEIMAQIPPGVMKSHFFDLHFGGLIGGIIGYLINKKYQQRTSHGTAAWATEADIKKAKLNADANGVVCGRNPYNHQIMLHDGPEHILLLAPTRSGKGVGIITPTGIIWKHSIFFFDPKAELWNMTSGWRKKHHKQKVMKFEPLCKDGSGARWNPFAEINFQSTDEMDDVTTIAEMMCKTGEKSGGDPFWENSAVALVKGVIMHLLYKHYQEGKDLPNPSDVMSFLSSPDMDTDHLFANMKIYPHISPKEFLEVEEWENVLDEDGKPQFDEEHKLVRKLKKKYHNPLKEIYGEYIPDLKPYKKALGLQPDTDEWFKVKTLEDLRLAILDYEKGCKPEDKLNWEAPDLSGYKDKSEIDTGISMADAKSPWYHLLVHPKVAESASNMYNGAKETRASIMQTTQTGLDLYQNPLIKANTAVSDFTVRDLLDPKQTVSLYLVLQPNDVEKLRPLTRLFISTMMSKLVRDMDFGEGGGTTNVVKQRLLLMLDEFPQLRKMEQIENQLAICAGYGVKICIVAQNIGQLNQLYTKENGIAANCHVQIYFTPADNDSARMLSDKLGDATITTNSVSSSGKLFEKNTSVSENARKLMTPDEASRMDEEKELVFVTGKRPIFADKIRFYKEPYFVKRVSVKAPPFSDTCTEVKDYDQLFAIHEPERRSQEEKRRKVELARKKAEMAQQQAAEVQENSGQQEEKAKNKVPKAEAEIQEPVQPETRAENEALSYNAPAQPTEEERKQEAEAFAKAAVCVSSQAHGRPVKQEKEAEHGEEAGKAENTEADRPEESQSTNNSRAEGAGQPAEPSEERPRSESENTVAVSLDEEGDDDDDDFADDADWQSFQQSQKQVG